MVMMSPFANSVRANPVQGSVQASAQGLGSIAQLLEQLRSAGPRPEAGARVPQEQPQLFTADVRQEPTQQIPAEAIQALQEARRPANPFEGNEQYQALMDFQKSLAPNQEQQQRLQELQQAFEGTGAYKDYRINELQQQLQQRQNPMMGMGLGGARPYGMDPYRGFGRPQFPMQQPMPVPRGGYNQYQNQFGGMMGMQQQPYQQPQYQNFNMQQPYMNPYQQMRPQPQQYGGYNQYQQMGGYGNYGAMPNPYQPQQMGYNPNNYGNYAQNQFQGYGGMQAQSQGVY